MAEYRVEFGLTFVEVEKFKLMAEIDYLSK